MEYRGFVGPSATNLSPLASCERTVNLYPEARDTQSGRSALYVTPGFAPYISAAGGIIDVNGRALAQMNGRAFGVVGAGVYELFATQTATRYGAVAQDGRMAQFAFNGIGGNQAGIESGGNFYSLDLATNVLSGAILTGEATQIGMLDGYGIVFNRALGKMRISDLNDFTTMDPTQFAIRSSSPDNWQAMLVNAPDIWLIGSQSGDVWFNANNFPFPLAPRSNVSFKYGIAAPDSIAAAGDSVLWLSGTAEGAGFLVRARGYVPQPVSSHAFESAVARYARTSRIDDAEALSTQFEGHTYYVIRFPSADATWGYDLEQGTMIELGKWNQNQNRFNVWAPRVTCYAFGKHLVADATSGTISDMDISYYTEADGSAKVWLRVPPSLQVERERLFVDRLRLNVETGVASATGQGAAPRVMMDSSRDNGKTWGVQRVCPVGMMGDTDQIVQFNACGSATGSWVPRFMGSDPIPWRLVGADVEGTGFNFGQAA